MRLNPTNISIIKRLLMGRSSRPLKSILSRLSPIDLASLLSLLNDRENRLLLDALISLGLATIALKELPPPKLLPLLKKIEHDKLVRLLEQSSVDDSAYFLSLMEEGTRLIYLSELNPASRQNIQQFLQYPEDSAGRIMHTQIFAVSSELKALEGLESLRTKARQLSIYYIYCINDENKLVGVVSLRDLATAPPDTILKDIAKSDVITVDPLTPAEDVARIVSQHDFIALPVVEQDGTLVGIITVDDILDIIQDQATANIYASAGLTEVDRVYSPPIVSIKTRLPWLFLNLILASVASSVISLFEDTMQHVIILATLNNIVAGMAGNTAIQTMTVITRGMAVGDFQYVSHIRAVLKEAIVGLTVGGITGLAAGILTFFWKGNLRVAIIISLSMPINALVSASVGALIPLIFKRFQLDPAAGSGVLVTVISDIFGFFSFLGLATLSFYFFA